VALAGFALLLLPGLVVVRAPWTAIAPLSLAFWALSAWWPPFASHSRSRFVAAALLAAVLLAALRLLPKQEVAPPPGWQAPPRPSPPLRPGLDPPSLASAASLLVLAVALLLLAPVPYWRNAPGPRFAFQTTTARLALWQDGLPWSGEPLVPLEPVAAHAPALATLVADLSIVARLDPGDAAPWVLAATVALVLVGAYGLHATWAPADAAALGALVGLSLVPWPAALSVFGDVEALAALAFLLPAAALVVGHRSRSSAVAAGVLLGAGSLAQPVLAAVVVVASLAFAVARAREPRAALLRVAAIVALGLATAAPGLLRLARALSAAEVSDVVRSTRAAEVLWLALGILGAILPVLALQGPLGGRLGSGRVARPAIAVAAAVILLVRLCAWVGAGQLAPPVRAGLRSAATIVPPLSALCAPDGIRDFVPALAGRPAGEPGVWVPPPDADEWARRARVACGFTLGSDGSVR
jgi:hypothetical protein